jgi:hypothetical protein
MPAGSASRVLHWRITDIYVLLLRADIKEQFIAAFGQEYKRHEKGTLTQPASVLLKNICKEYVLCVNVVSFYKKCEGVVRIFQVQRSEES